MEPTDVTVRILQEIRDDIHGLREDQQAFRTEQAEFNRTVVARFESIDGRFEIIQTTLRDLAQQLVILGRGVKC